MVWQAQAGDDDPPDRAEFNAVATDGDADMFVGACTRLSSVSPHMTSRQGCSNGEVLVFNVTGPRVTLTKRLSEHKHAVKDLSCAG